MKALSTIVLSLATALLFLSCKDFYKDSSTPVATDRIEPESNKKSVLAVMEKHLKAVTERDVESLESTLSPHGTMQLILPGMEIVETSNGFLANQKEWFESGEFTFETNILNTEVGEQLAMVIVEGIYREQERNGKPYFNRMIISYTLKKIDGNWYVIKDHASSAEKSTDSE